MHCGSLWSRLELTVIALLFGVAAAVAQATPVPSPPGVSPAPPSPGMEKPSADASTGQLVEHAARPVLRLRAASTWDDGFAEIRKSMLLLGEEARRLGLITGTPPMVHFVTSDDLGFTFEAMLPLAAPAAPGTQARAGFELAQSPAGRAIIFTHEGPYDDIDAAYEAITAFLDEKGLTSTGTYLEEYLFWPEKSDDPGLKLNIVVFLR
ncbi:MAG: GyrI-like domain-containing protein [Methylobacterium sp.]|nr:GyrI-like domain-containing protein [Methylobacterium sp.]